MTSSRTCGNRYTARPIRRSRQPQRRGRRTIGRRTQHRRSAQARKVLWGTHPPRIGHELRQSRDIHVCQSQHHQRPAVVGGRGEEHGGLAEQESLLLGLVTDVEHRDVGPQHPGPARSALGLGPDEALVGHPEVEAVAVDVRHMRQRVCCASYVIGVGHRGPSRIAPPVCGLAGWCGEQVGRPHLAQTAAVTVAHCRLRGVAGLRVWPVSTRDDRNEQDLVRRRIGIRMRQGADQFERRPVLCRRWPLANGYWDALGSGRHSDRLSGSLSSDG